MTKQLLLVFVLMALAACGKDDSMAGMDHSSGAMNTTAPFDAQFIDGMIEHHTSAIAMAEQALKESQRAEIKELAQTIISSQQTEVTQMTEWRKQWYADVAATGGMGMDMGAMTISNDANKSFDQRFLEAMISHHEGALTMAKEAQTKATRAEIKTLAGTIITAQEAEIAQMKTWLKDWFGVQ